MEDAGTLTVGPRSADPLAGAIARQARTPNAADTRVFDRLTRLVAAMLDVPVALLLLVDHDQLVFASHVGPEDPWGTIREFPLADAYCQFAVGPCTTFAVDDSRSHPLVSKLPSTTDLGVVAYLGVPLMTAAGTPIGMLCAIDFEPRAWSDRDIAPVEDLAATVMAYIEAKPAPAEPVTPGLNIAAVARRTGVGADTLRKWELRYGVLRPQRTAGGQRRYDDADVSRVEWLRDRLAEGFRISEAAALLDSTGQGAPSSTEELCDALVEAAHAADPARLVSLVEQAFALHEVDGTIEKIVQPALARIGSEQAERSGAVAEEHLLAETVRARLERMLADRRPAVRGTVVLACAPGERRDLGLLALGVMLQADGWLVAYLGTDVPLESVAEFAQRSGAQALCLSLASPESVDRLTADLTGIGLPTSLRIVIGGSAVSGAPGLAATVESLRG